MSLNSISLRYLSIYFALISLLMSMLVVAYHFLWNLPTPERLLFFTLPAHTCLAGISIYLAFKRRIASEKSVLFLMLTSMCLLAFFLYDTGGQTNPLISLMLLPLAMSATLLGMLSTLVLTVTGIGAYTLLTHYYLPIHTTGPHAQHHNMQLHLLGMWLTFAVSASVIVALITPMANSMRKQNELISRQRETMLRDERLVAIATFAASAAHQLGTPLSTLLLLCEEMKEIAEDHPNNNEYATLAEKMEEQIRLCKTTLHTMMNRSDQVRRGTQVSMSLMQWLEDMRIQFNLLNPSKCLTLQHGDTEQIFFAHDITLDQAILNLLENSARASQSPPVLCARAENNRLKIEIIDAGPGISDEILEQLGTPFVRGRQTADGLGLGLFLSHATIERLGGTLHLRNTGAGTLTQIELPLVEANPA